MAGTPDLVRQQVDRIVSSGIFLQSERLCRFLRFTVEAKLNGEAGQIKEYLLGREVFDRNHDYDPRTDPIVRVEARRLRRKLDEYYAGPGASDPIRIEFPKGAYTPEFVLPSAPETPRRGWLAALGIAAAAVILVLLYVRFQPRDPNLLVVLPARWVWKAESFPVTPHDEDLAERVAAELATRHHVPVIAWPALQRFRHGDWTTPRIAGELGARRALLIAVRHEPQGSRVTAFLIDARTDRKLGVIDQPGLDLTQPAATLAAVSAIAGKVAVQ